MCIEFEPIHSVRCRTVYLTHEIICASACAEIFKRKDCAIFKSQQPLHMPIQVDVVKLK